MRSISHGVVKGRAGTGDIEVSSNEWARACNLRQEYWLHVVFDAASPRPRLVRVQDQFAKLLVKSRGVIVNDRDIIEVGEAGWAEPSSGGLDARQLRFWQTMLDLPAGDVDRWVKQAKDNPWGGRGAIFAPKY